MSGNKPKPIPNGLKFLFGGSAGMAGIAVIQPLDLLKSRMQVAGKAGKNISGVQVFIGVVKNEGILGLYNGLSAALLRQATYTTARLGIFTTLFDAFTIDGRPPNLAIKTALGMFAGVTGSFIGNPCDVALIRMSVDGRLPEDQRRNYKNVFDALVRIFKEEGIKTWWRGAVPTMGRAMVVNAAQLATYSQAKQSIQEAFRMDECLFLHFCASFISGLVTSTTSLPVDIVKTRLQNMKTFDGNPEFSGVGDVFFRIVKEEGVLALWKGFGPYYMRVGSHTLFTFIFLEQLNSAYRKIASP